MDGNFKVQTTANNFYLEISFINYSNQVVEEFDLQGARINLGQSNRSNRGYQSKVRCRIEPNNHSIIILIGDSDCGDEIPKR